MEKHINMLLVGLVLTTSALAQYARDGFYEPEESKFGAGGPDPVNDHGRSAFQGLKGSVASIDQRYPRNAAPVVTGDKTWKGVAWAGERLNGQLVLWTQTAIPALTLSATELRNKDGEGLGPHAIRPRFVRYTKGHEGIYADVLETAPTIPVREHTTRPVWLTVDVPRSAKPGHYRGTVTAAPDNGAGVRYEINVEVLPLLLTESKSWPFHLDLWQNPFAVARYHQVELWSDEHFALMRPLYEMLADAGQKCVTTSILKTPWGAQTHDGFGEMITWIKDGDSWSYDYSVFDKYVEFVFSTGIDQQINCYSMIPWGSRYAYFDKALNKSVTFKAKPGTEAYTEHWKPFLKSFIAHLKEKGWADKTAIAMDERPHAVILQSMSIIKEVAPELKVASAINYTNKDGSIDMYDVSLSIGHADKLKPAYLKLRQDNGLKTTFYVCCGPDRPNTFPHSPPAESAWQALHAASLDLSGFLRWAYCSWVKDPLLDTSHPERKWLPGDCFLVYPGGRSSVRFERLREGIQAYEKIRLLRMWAAESKNPEIKQALVELNDSVQACKIRPTRYKKLEQGAEAETVNRTYDKMQKLARLLPH